LIDWGLTSLLAQIGYMFLFFFAVTSIHASISVLNKATMSLS